MCFFYALSQDAQTLKNRYQLKLDFDFEFLGSMEPKFYSSGFDFPKMPVITNAAPEMLQSFSWGLIPSWVKTPEEAREIRTYTLNARRETVLTKPAFRSAVRKKRCLVPAEGFYEWRLFNGKKYPYYIYLKNAEIFSIAGIWETWTDPSTGEVIKTFSILTTEANPLLAKIHNTKRRMPVILPPNKEKTWLRDDLTSEEILALTRPYDENLMEAHTIGKLITSRTENRNVPAVREAHYYNELSEK